MGCASSAYNAKLQKIEDSLAHIQSTLKRQQEQLQNQEDLLMVLNNTSESHARKNLPVLKLTEPTHATRSQQEPVLINDALLAQSTPSHKTFTPSGLKEAYTLFKTGQFKEAAEMFKETGRNSRTPSTKEEAVYWEASCYTALKDWKNAVVAYARFTDDFPQSKKMPEALLQLGLSYKALSENEQAEQVFATLVTAYPHTPSSELARQHLSMHKH